MQIDIDLLSTWMHENKLFLNKDKCLYFEIIGKCSTTRQGSLGYELNGDTLRKADSFRDLGLEVDSSLSFKVHVQNIRVLCYRLINLCFKYFIIREPAPFIRFYRVYVVPIVIYCSSIYVFVSISNIKNVERIQKYFTKRLYARIHPN